MASHGRLHLLVLFFELVLFVVAIATAAPMPAASLAERLEGEGSQQCWEVLMEIRSCTGEIILFFLNGEAYLGPGCCRAIRVIEQCCWAADVVLSVVGFTPEEGDMLKGYCDAGSDVDGGDHRPPPPTALAPQPRRALDSGARASAAAASSVLS